MLMFLPRIRPVISKSPVFAVTTERSEADLEKDQATEICGQVITLVITEISIKQGSRIGAENAIVTRFGCNERVARQVVDRLYPEF